MGRRTVPPPEHRAGEPEAGCGNGRRRAAAWILTGLMLCGLLPGAVQAQVRGLIVGPGAERYRIAVSPLKNLGIPNDVERLSERIADVIADDLDRSGWFTIIDRSAYIEHPSEPGSGSANSTIRTGRPSEPTGSSRAASGSLANG